MPGRSRHSLIMLLDEQLDPKQIEIYRKMTPQQRLGRGRKALLVGS